MNLRPFELCWPESPCIFFSVLLALEYQSCVSMCGQNFFKAHKSVQQSGSCRWPKIYILPDLDKTLICIGHRITAAHDVRFRRTDVQGSVTIL